MAISRTLLLATMCCAGALRVASAQHIRDHYVSKAEADGTIYHTLPCTLFENREAGDLTFDITYKEHGDGRATLNFTYEAAQAMPADSIRFVSGTVVLSGPVERLYMEPDRKVWRHRYTFRTPVAGIRGFFNEATEPSVTIFSGGRSCPYRVKRSAWRSYAPVGYRIFEMIRINEEE